MSHVNVAIIVTLSLFARKVRWRGEKRCGIIIIIGGVIIINNNRWFFDGGWKEGDKVIKKGC